MEPAGLGVASVSEILHRDGEAAALQIILVDGSSLVWVVWTDWSLRVERFDKAGIRIGAELEVGDRVIRLRSSGGDLVVSQTTA
ncbi:hypothetical protein OHS18_21940 [Amycolatopsis sp. NBC_00355]|uniref:hypothetical protein n=1 Tax=Amycolatopsis sp. NBC_00355 TaxID=2975957 RepID=UPI002E26B00E